jgi:hypothetical protein
LAVNTFTSFEPDPPVTKTSGARLVAPDPSKLTVEDFDEQGKIKKSSFVEQKFAAYPDKHSVTPPHPGFVCEPGEEEKARRRKKGCRGLANLLCLRWR